MAVEEEKDPHQMELVGKKEDTHHMWMAVEEEEDTAEDRAVEMVCGQHTVPHPHILHQHLSSAIRLDSPRLVEALPACSNKG